MGIQAIQQLVEEIADRLRAENFVEEADALESESARLVSTASADDALTQIIGLCHIKVLGDLNMPGSVPYEWTTLLGKLEQKTRRVRKDLAMRQVGSTNHQNHAAALRAVDTFIEVLESECLSAFVVSFRAIADALRTGDARRAVKLYNAVSVGGMGGLSDVWPSDPSKFDHTWGAVGRAFAELRAEIEGAE